jgi:hypothetical protein
MHGGALLSSTGVAAAAATAALSFPAMNPRKAAAA